MSLINQVLQDLDKRGASSAERGTLPNQVRALPRTEKSGIHWWLLGITAALIVIAALAWQLGYRSPTAAPPLLTRAAPPIAASKEESPATEMPLALAQILTASAPTHPASRLALELEIVPSADNRPAPAQSRLSKSPEKSSQMLPAMALSAIAKPSSNLPLTADKVTAGEPAISVTPTAMPVIAAKLATSAANAVDNGAEATARAAIGNPQIDKRLQKLTPSQLAENEYRDAANLLSQGRLAETQEGFQRALQLDPRHIGARQGLFGLLVEAKKDGEAEQVLRDGLKLNPNQPGFALAISGLQYQRGDSVGAIETLQRTAPAAQGSPDYLARLAALLQRQSRHQEAVEHYQAALRLAPGSGVWLMGLGISQQALNRNGDAQDAFRRARASNTLNPDLQAFVDQRMKQLQ